MIETKELQGQVALVTGGAQGLGAAIARALSSAGATVVIADRQVDLAHEVARELVAGGGTACALELDVTDEQNAADVVRIAVDEYGRLDALINNAGTDVTVSVEELTVADWDRVVGVNLRAPFVLSRLAFPIMRNQGGGHIINIVSTASKRPCANASAYHASKWG
ncbi:MAG TPA: SDR family NAD(P)-dependent oxidoreductase, partial [Anaerolineae bacterium]|nr:SDR family NAD(P)-dependent oxidoreductase [Anaerolineae bacterium]